MALTDCTETVCLMIMVLYGVSVGLKNCTIAGPRCDDVKVLSATHATVAGQSCASAKSASM